MLNFYEFKNYLQVGIIKYAFEGARYLLLFSLLTFLQEKTALKKLDGIKNEHVKRLDALKSEQEIDIHKARLIELNLTMVS